MIIDGSLLFTGTSNGATGGITSTANQDSVAQVAGTYVCSNIVDLGVISGVPTSASGGGARDLGIGDDPMPKLLIVVPVALTSGGSATVQVELDGAPDSGTGTPGSYTIMWQSQAIGYATLTAGAQIANIDLPRPVPGQPLPRFLRLRFIVATATVTAGTIEAAIVIDRFDQPTGTTGALSGMPAGIYIAN
jgi:hypothetical protein